MNRTRSRSRSVVLASPLSVIGCATGTVSGTMQGSGAMPCLRIRCLTVSRISSSAAEMSLALSLKGAQFTWAHLIRRRISSRLGVDARRSATAAASSKCLRSSGSG